MSYEFNEEIPHEAAIKTAAFLTAPTQGRIQDPAVQLAIGTHRRTTLTRRSPSGRWRVITLESSFDNCSAKEIIHLSSLLGMISEALLRKLFPPYGPGRPPASDPRPKLKIGFWGPCHERDVEILFIEPLLSKLGYGRGNCRKRRVYTLDMSKVVPDYSFGNKHETSMILESKYRVHTRGEFDKGCEQVTRYAQLLGCRVACLASLDGLWIFSRADGAFDESHHVGWERAMSAEGLTEISKVIGPAAILGSTS